MHSIQPGFIYSACEPLQTIKERIQKNKETVDSLNIYENELDKACFQHSMAYEDFKVLTRRIASDKILQNKAFNIAKNLKHDRYQRGLASMVYTFFDKKTSGSCIKNENIFNKELTAELREPVIRRFNKRKR